jgi:PAS domain-containing protein
VGDQNGEDELNIDLRTLTYAPCALLVLDGELKPLSGSRKGFFVFGVRLTSGEFEQSLSELGELMSGEKDFAGLLTEAAGKVRRPGNEVQFQWERRERVFDVTVGSIEARPDPGYMVLFSDVTESNRLEDIRETTRRYLEDILNNIQLGVVVLNQEMRVTNMNRAQERFLQRLGTWISWIDAIGMPVSELSEQDVGLDWKAITQQVLVKGETYSDAQRIYQTLEGNLVLSVEISPLKDGRGQTIGAIQVSEDVTEKVLLEQELRRAEIVTERLGAVRETAIAVNHEVNNPLTTILATAQMLMLSEKDFSEDMREKLKQVEVDAKRIANVTKRLRLVEEVKTKDYISEGPKMLDLGMEGE